MAIASDPSTGISPRASPSLRRPVRRSSAAPKAATGPPTAARPKAISPMTPVEAISTTKIT